MEKNDSRSSFSAFRLRKDTVKYLQEMKRAFEISYGKEFTNDDFIKQMASSIENGDHAVWEIWTRMQTSQRELENRAAELRQQHDLE